MSPTPSTRSDPVASVRSGPRRALDGVWVNQLGSRLELEADTAGCLRGTFRTGVGDDTEAHPLTGWSEPPRADTLGVLGFTVRWPATRAVSVWAGQVDPSREVIEATWLLVGERTPDEAWHATTLGHDEFHREPRGA